MRNLIQGSIPGRTKDSSPRDFGFENCAFSTLACGRSLLAHRCPDSGLAPKVRWHIARLYGPSPSGRALCDVHRLFDSASPECGYVKIRLFIVRALYVLHHKVVC